MISKRVGEVCKMQISTEIEIRKPSCNGVDLRRTVGESKLCVQSERGEFLRGGWVNLVRELSS